MSDNMSFTHCIVVSGGYFYFVRSVLYKCSGTFRAGWEQNGAKGGFNNGLFVSQTETQLQLDADNVLCPSKWTKNSMCTSSGEWFPVPVINCNRCVQPIFRCSILDQELCFQLIMWEYFVQKPSTSVCVTGDTLPCKQHKLQQWQVGIYRNKITEDHPQCLKEPWDLYKSKRPLMRRHCP